MYLYRYSFVSYGTVVYTVQSLVPYSSYSCVRYCYGCSTVIFCMAEYVYLHKNRVYVQSWHPTSKEVLRSITVYSKCITFLYLLPSFLHRVSHSFAFLPSFATQSPSLPSQALTPLSPSPPLPRPTSPFPRESGQAT